MAKLELFYPVKNPFIVSQKFGENPDFYKVNYGTVGHNGWDIVGEWGQIIRAAHDGIIVYAGTDSNEGWGIVIRTLDEREYKEGKAFFKTIYWHCQANSFLVKVGDKVSVGQPIARCGNTGLAKVFADRIALNPTYGTHLHFGLKPIYQGENDWTWFNLEQTNGYYGAIDPEPYFDGMYAEDYATISAQLKVISLKVAELLKKISTWLR